MVNDFLRKLARSGNRSISDYIKINPNIDLLEEEGSYFVAACFAKNINGLKILIKHYIKRNLRGDPKSIEHLYAYKKLRNVLKHCSDITCNTDEINALLSEYIALTDSGGDCDQDLEGFDIPPIENYMEI